MEIRDPNATGTRRDRRRARTYRRLLDAGDELFRTQGFEAITVEQLAATADVAKGTFFNYFDSKEALLGALLGARIQAILVSCYDSQASPMDQIWQLLTAVRHELMPYAHLVRRMFAYAASHPDYGPSSQEHRTMSEILAGLVREAQHQGVFRDTHDAAVVGAMIASYFFRVCVLECTMRGEADQANSSSSGNGRSVADFDWEAQMHAGLNVLYEGLVVT